MTKSKQVMTNREIGLVWTADILGRLFELWPRKTNLEPEPTIDSTGVSAELEDEAFKLWHELGEWLENEGIIRKERGFIGRPTIHRAVLTARGFELLGKPTPGTEKSLGTQLGDLAKDVGKQAAKEGAKKAATDLVGSFLGNFVKGLTT